MNELIELLATVPYGLEVMTALGTGTALVTVATPLINVIVKVTPWTWDDELLKNPVISKVLWFGKQLKRFSLI